MYLFKFLTSKFVYIYDYLAICCEQVPRKCFIYNTSLCINTIQNQFIIKKQFIVYYINKYERE